MVFNTEMYLKYSLEPAPTVCVVLGTSNIERDNPLTEPKSPVTVKNELNCDTPLTYSTTNCLPVSPYVIVVSRSVVSFAANSSTENVVPAVKDEVLFGVAATISKSL